MPERDLVKLLQNSLVKTLTDAVGLRMGFDAVFNTPERQVNLINMRFRLPAVLGATIGQNTDQAYVLFCKERQYLSPPDHRWLP